MEKALNLKGVMIKGRPILIKRSNRNITKSNPNKKRKREDDEILNDQKQNSNKDNKGKKSKKEIKDLEYNENKDEENTNQKNLTNEIQIVNKNSAYISKPDKDQKKQKMKNTDFKKFLTK